MGYPGAFALDATHLYQTESAHDAVSRETLDGLQDGLLEDGTAQTLAPDRLAVSQSSLVTDAIAISGQNVVWANGTNIEFHVKDKDEFEGGTLSVLANSAGFNALSGFVISDGKIYFGETGDNNVEVVPISSFTPSANAADGHGHREESAEPGPVRRRRHEHLLHDDHEGRRDGRLQDHEAAQAVATGASSAHQ